MSDILNQTQPKSSFKIKDSDTLLNNQSLTHLYKCLKYHSSTEEIDNFGKQIFTHLNNEKRISFQELLNLDTPRAKYSITTDNIMKPVDVLNRKLADMYAEEIKVENDKLDKLENDKKDKDKTDKLNNVIEDSD